MRKSFILVLALCLASVVAPAQTFSTTLTGAAERPGPGDPDGSGIAVVSMNGTTVTYTLLVSNINTPTMAHIHRGTIDASGDIEVDFSPSFVNGTATGTVTISQALANEIAGNPAGFYVNVHTSDFEGGAIRGQLGAATSGEAGSRVSYLPVVGKVNTFVTDVRIVNESNATANVTLDFFQVSAAGQTGPTATRDLTVAPGEQAVLDDVIATLNTSQLGGMRITSDQNVTVNSRVINDLRSINQGTTGFATTSLELDDARTSGTLSFLSEASASDKGADIGFRSNLGYFNPTANPVELTLTARRTTDGAVLGSKTLAVPGYSFVQQSVFTMINTVPAADQVQPNFYVSWTSTGPLFVYGSVVDNKTEDPVLIQ